MMELAPHLARPNRSSLEDLPARRVCFAVGGALCRDELIGLALYRRNKA